MYYEGKYKYTERLLDMVEDHLLDRDIVIIALVKYMGEDAVRDCMLMNEFVDIEVNYR